MSQSVEIHKEVIDGKTFTVYKFYQGLMGVLCFGLVASLLRALAVLKGKETRVKYRGILGIPELWIED